MLFHFFLVVFVCFVFGLWGDLFCWGFKKFSCCLGKKVDRVSVCSARGFGLELFWRSHRGCLIETMTLVYLQKAPQLVTPGHQMRTVMDDCLSEKSCCQRI